MTTLKDVANQAGLSVQTVSRILNGDNKEVWPSSIRRADKVRAIAKKMNFRPSATARTMRSKKTRMVGVLIRNTADIPHTAPTNYEIILGIYHHLENAGYEICLVHQSDIGKRSRIFREKMLDGLIVIGDMQPAMIQEIRETFNQCVWVDVNVYESQYCIQRDEYAAGRMVGDKVLEAGYDQLIWLTRVRNEGVSHYSAVNRFKGFEDAINSVDRPIDLRSVYVDDQTIAELDSVLGAITPQTAVVTSGATGGPLMVNWAMSKGLMPGRDFGLATPDDCLSLHEIDSGISRVHFDRLAMGQQAGKMLLDQMASMSATSTMMPVRWIEGFTLGLTARQ